MESREETHPEWIKIICNLNENKERAKKPSPDIQDATDNSE
jgi:hypothetical protein